MGFRALGLGFGYWEWKKMSKWEWDKYFYSLLTVTRMGFEHWEVGFGKSVGWEMELEPPLQDPLSRPAEAARL